MATTPGFSYALSEKSAVHHFINTSISDSADLFELADACTACVRVLVDYAVALTLAVMNGTLPASVAKELTGLLHDMVWLLAEFVKEPYITSH
ncbi:hypothetical protein ENASMMO064B1_02425 [Enterobacter asburiae]|uniref:hypothetical protein n=1 Tax=Enterobacter TaxID=547 RepID=UPI0004DB4380|nr:MULTISPECIES: hypothetical protein [Enterobacter]KFA83788.1 hypothetical protein N037_07915 [Enterobacter sp. EGD-HP1]MCK6785895.1 hypothetical protein [Enterobacter roggenkampii]MCM7836179.1 hypothetical protein [Enterobacter asburiae]HDW3275394.1 hypothetical protein [Enterobacter asburiae]